jgi:fibrillarin-like pre-rRNA processing protein
LNVRVEGHKNFPEIYWAIFEDGSQRLATKNFASGRKVYGERLIRYGNEEYRVWDPFRSKLAASIFKDLKNVPIKPGNKVLYLGAASGTTASHVSDIVGKEGHVYCVEFAVRSVQKLLNNVCSLRFNMSPILADARFPERYMILLEEVENIYCDIAQPQQAKILVNNANFFLESEGVVMFAIKARSIDVTKEPKQLYERETKILEANGFRVKDSVNLKPYHKAHVIVVAQR